MEVRDSEENVNGATALLEVGASTAQGDPMGSGEDASACGCRAVGSSRRSIAGVAALLSTALLLVRARRRPGASRRRA